MDRITVWTKCDFFFYRDWFVQDGGRPVVGGGFLTVANFFWRLTQRAAIPLKLRRRVEEGGSQQHPVVG